MSETLRVAEDHVPEYADLLNAPDGVVAGAKRLARQFHGVDPEYQPVQCQPSTVAVACLHVSAQMREETDRTLAEVATQSGKNQQSLSNAITHIGDELANATPLGDGETA